MGDELAKVSSLEAQNGALSKKLAEVESELEAKKISEALAITALSCLADDLSKFAPVRFNIPPS